MQSLITERKVWYAKELKRFSFSATGLVLVYYLTLSIGKNGRFLIVSLHLTGID
jgi:hypothetical protein